VTTFVEGVAVGMAAVLAWVAYRILRFVCKGR